MTETSEIEALRERGARAIRDLDDTFRALAEALHIQLEAVRAAIGPLAAYLAEHAEFLEADPEPDPSSYSAQVNAPLSPATTEALNARLRGGDAPRRKVRRRADD